MRVIDRLVVVVASCALLPACDLFKSDDDEATPPPAPTVSLTASPTSVTTGGSTTLTWSSTDATACAASGGWTGSRPTSGSESITLTQQLTFSLTCTGAGGNGSAQATVAVQPPPPTPTVSLSANPTTVLTGSNTTLTWSSTDATSCVASGGWTGSRATSGSESIAVAVATTFALACTGVGGTGNAQVTVAVQSPPPAPTVSLSANPTAVPAGGSTTLTWSSTNAASCVASGGWTGSRPTSGSTSITVNQQTTFSLACTGTGGTGNAQVTVTILPAPTVSLSANPTSVPAGSNATLTWSSTNATSCTASGGWTGSRPTSGSESTTINQQTTFTLTCTGAGGSGNAQVTVAIQAAPTVSLSANPTSLPTGSNTTLTWSSTNATSCTASGGWTGSRPTSGSTSLAVNQQTTFTLTCTGAGGSGNAQVTVGVGPPVGLDTRPSNLTCVAPVKASGNAGNTISLQRVFSNVSFNQPVAMLQAPGDGTRWFVVEKVGNVRVFANTASPTASTFITIPVNSDDEGGLLGMAFHPNWATNRQVYLSFTEGSPMTSVVARYTVSADGLTANPATRVNIIRVPQPATNNHKGGQIAFGPGGFLFFGLGDGGGGGDPISAAQDTTDLLGSMLRLDVDGGTPYAIPLDNPFAGGAVCDQRAHTNTANNCPEIYAWGLRNPWRWSFDSANGDLWLGDVGQGELEEIDRVQRGGNYGWDCREGTMAYESPAASCSTATGLINPVHEYGRSLGFSVTGGYVYRGTALPALVGRYLFGDYGSGRIWRLVPNGGGFTAEQLLDSSAAIASFGQGNDGELYVVDINGESLHKIVDGGGAPPPGPPVATQLSATGCVNPQSPSQPASGLVPFSPAAPFWSDNGVKERWLAIPNSTSISVGAGGDFTFPNGTVLMKHFRLGGNLVETRLFMRHPDGDWAGYTYEWNAQLTDATLVQGGKTVTIGAQSWIFPSENDCLTCHTAAAGFALGPETVQLNHDFLYTATNRTANQLRTLDWIAMFTTPLGDPALQPTMPNPADTAAPLAQRARAYLHSNCAGCHRTGGPTPSSMDLRYATLLSATLACDAIPQSGDLGIGAAARIIAPGSAANSVLVARMNRRGANQMPPLASNIVDTAGVTLVSDWIASLTACQ